MFRLLHLGSISICSVFALVCLGLSAHIINFKAQNSLPQDAPASFALATSVISLVTLVPLVVMNATRTRSLATYVAVEVGLLFVLWVFWLALGADIAASGINSLDCSDLGQSLGLTAPSSDMPSSEGPFSRREVIQFTLSDFEEICRETQAIEGLAFVNWILLTLTFAVLIVAAVRQRAWKTPVHELGAPPGRARDIAYPIVPTPALMGSVDDDRKTPLEV